MKRYILTMCDNGEFADIQKMGEDDIIIGRSYFKELRDMEKRYKEHLNSLKDHRMIGDKEYSEYCKFKIRHLQENLINFSGGTPADWACFHITRFLHDYLKEHNVEDNASVTEKRMQTIAFAHCLEDKLLDYIDKLEEFNS